MKTLGVVTIVLASLSLLCGLGHAAAGVAMSVAAWAPDKVDATPSPAPSGDRRPDAADPRTRHKVLAGFLFGLPALVCGWGFVRGRTWALPLGLAVGCIAVARALFAGLVAYSSAKQGRGHVGLAVFEALVFAAYCVFLFRRLRANGSLGPPDDFTGEKRPNAGPARPSQG